MTNPIDDFKEQELRFVTFNELMEFSVLGKITNFRNESFLDETPLDPSVIFDFLYHQSNLTVLVFIEKNKLQTWTIKSNYSALIQVAKWGQLMMSINNSDPKYSFDEFIADYADDLLKDAYFKLNVQESLEFKKRLYNYKFIINFI
jgi:hypothetical protein